MNKLSFDNLFTRFEIVQAKGKTNSFRIHFYIKTRSSEQAQIIVHEQLFATRDDAIRMVSRIVMRGAINLDHWIWSVNKEHSVTAFHVKPVARYKTQPIEVKDETQ